MKSKPQSQLDEEDRLLRQQRNNLSLMLRSRVNPYDDKLTQILVESPNDARALSKLVVELLIEIRSFTKPV